MLDFAKFRRWIAEKICPECFFNKDASSEIDRLTLELEKLREEVGRDV